MAKFEKATYMNKNIELVLQLYDAFSKKSINVILELLNNETG